MRPHPRVYEIATVPWLNDLGNGGPTVTLGTVPSREWDRLGELGLDYVWLMGVWDKSLVGRDLFRARTDMAGEYDAALPGWTKEDIIGSPYSIRSYRPDDAVGTWKDLERAREELAKRRIGLILDFVPNHTGLDHPWIAEHPEYYVRGNGQHAEDTASFYVAPSRQVIARGRDPNFPAWFDTAQLDYFSEATRAAMIGELRTVSEHCDGVRCDMAMLLLNQVFARTWEWLVRTPPPSTEFWAEARAAVPGLTFIAEAYWDTEWTLQQLGFDFCYDKRLYDRLRHSPAADIRAHLGASDEYQQKLVRFLENHDEPRARAAFDGRHQPAAVLCATLPGMRLWHHGQLSGRRVRLPVMLRRARPEPDDELLGAFYERLLQATHDDCFHHGRWHHLPVHPAFDGSAEHLIAFAWELGRVRRVVVVNLHDGTAQGRVPMGTCLPDGGGGEYRFHDALDGNGYLRSGDELLDSGLHVVLGPHQSHLFTVERA
jgi:hypothetical protein